jgi:acyl-CoA dehydrogenase
MGYRTEPNTGLETLKLKTQAVKDGDDYLISGQKIWISSAQVATKMVLLARTTPLEEVKKPSEGLSLFFIDFDPTAPGQFQLGYFYDSNTFILNTMQNL